MSKRDKLIQKIMKGKNVSYDEAAKILMELGYMPKQPSGGSSHITFRKDGCNQITLVQTHKQLKEYHIKQIQEAINNE
jgi:hypothetical protein